MDDRILLIGGEKFSHFCISLETQMFLQTVNLSERSTSKAWIVILVVTTRMFFFLERLLTQREDATALTAFCLYA